MIDECALRAIRSKPLDDLLWELSLLENLLGRMELQFPHRRPGSTQG